LGSRVVSAVTQPGGFSPGAAARLVLADGRRAFAKAVAMQGGPPPEHVCQAHPVTKAAHTEAATAVISALAGYFVWQSRKPPPPGIPTVREFQRAQGQVALSWLRQRTGWT
jgi:hypothetical protein